MPASARELLVPFFTPFVWCGWDSNPRPPALKADALLTKLSGWSKMKNFLALSLSDVVFIMLIKVKMPTIVGILNFMSRINFVLS